MEITISILFLLRFFTIKLLQSAIASMFPRPCPGNVTVKMTSGENLFVSLLASGCWYFHRGRILTSQLRKVSELLYVDAVEILPKALRKCCCPWPQSCAAWYSLYYRHIPSITLNWHLATQKQRHSLDELSFKKVMNKEKENEFLYWFEWVKAV